MHRRRLIATVAPVVGVLRVIGVGTPLAQARESVIAPEVAALYNVLRNPGFEEGAQMPTGWGHHPPAPKGGNELQRDTRARHSGRASGFINWVAPLERS